MKKWLGILLAVLLLALCAGAAADVMINDYYFPDTFFMEYVRQSLNTDQDNVLSDAEMEAVTELDLSEWKITTLKGKTIQYVRENRHQHLEQTRPLRSFQTHEDAALYVVGQHRCVKTA